MIRSLSDSNDLIIHAGQLHNGFSEDLLVKRVFRALGRFDQLAGTFVKFFRSMEDCLMLLSFWKAFSFYRHTMEELRPRDPFHILQHLYQVEHVMTVYGPE